MLRPRGQWTLFLIFWATILLAILLGLLALLPYMQALGWVRTLE